VHALAANQLAIALPPARAEDEMAAVIGAVEALRERTQQRLALERERDALIEQLRDQSNTDALTGLANRRGFLEAAERLLAQARRHGFGVVAILLDIDHFKRFNDELGHAVGDAVLAEVAGVIRREIRGSDLCGRLGGEEFVLLLAHCDFAQGRIFAERLRRAIEALAAFPPKTPGGAPVRTTASLGVATFGAHCASLELLLSQADAAMYRAKTAGRNRVMPVA
jgi:diguanylate cyclase (GGDEF)-like protein